MNGKPQVSMEAMCNTLWTHVSLLLIDVVSMVIAYEAVRLPTQNNLWNIFL